MTAHPAFCALVGSEFEASRDWTQAHIGLSAHTVKRRKTHLDTFLDACLD